MLPSGPFTREQWAQILNLPVDQIHSGAVVSLGLGYGGLKVMFKHVAETRRVPGLSPLPGW